VREGETMTYDKLYVLYDGVRWGDRTKWIECQVIRETKTHVLVRSHENGKGKHEVWLHKVELEERGYAYCGGSPTFHTREWLDRLRDRAKPQPATRDEILKDFREKAKACHPDLGGDPAEFRRLVEERDRALRTAP
jgi:hypothetical protein